MDKATFYQEARSDVRGPLEGITVIEATTTWAGPMAGCVLADFGATVIKVEHPQGEVARKLPPLLPNSSLTVPHETVNRNKKNITLDLKLPKGRDLFLKLCEGADILVENFKPGTLAEWGVGYKDVKLVKSDIIYVSVSMYGQFGPYSERPGYDPLAQNFTGWSSLNGPPNSGPTKAPTFLADDLGGLHGALGALAALTRRNISGEGQHVDVALVDSLIFQSNGYLTSGKMDIPLPKMGNQFSIAAPVNVYECSDGSIYGGVLLDNHWKALCVLMDRTDLVDLSAGERIDQREIVDKVVADWCAERTREEVVTQLSDIGLAVTNVNTYGEAAEHPQVESRDMLQKVNLSDGNSVPLTGPAAKFSKTPTKIHNAAPRLGENNVEIYQSLGLGAEELEQLEKEGVI